MIDDNAKAPALQDVEPGSDADANPAPEVGQTPKNPNTTEPAPLETEVGEQADDNIDDNGNKSGGGKLDQPT